MVHATQYRRHAVKIGEHFPHRPRGRGDPPFDDHSRISHGNLLLP
ncbi:hypothetical protein [Streptomyces montanus]|nr:hypothetical protein [Streptomyces montanus]